VNFTHVSLREGAGAHPPVVMVTGHTHRLQRFQGGYWRTLNQFFVWFEPALCFTMACYEMWPTKVQYEPWHSKMKHLNPPAVKPGVGPETSVVHGLGGTALYGGSCFICFATRSSKVPCALRCRCSRTFSAFTAALAPRSGCIVLG